MNPEEREPAANSKSPNATESFATAEIGAPSLSAAATGRARKQHARFTLVAAEEVAVEDLGSTNGTRVGGRRVDRATLKPGDEVLLGSVVASVHMVQRGEQRALGLDRHDAFRAAFPGAAGLPRHRADAGSPSIRQAPPSSE